MATKTVLLERRTACNRLFSVWDAWDNFKSCKVRQTVYGMWRGHQRVLTCHGACIRLVRNNTTSYTEFIKMHICFSYRFWALMPDAHQVHMCP